MSGWAVRNMTAMADTGRGPDFLPPPPPPLSLDQTEARRAEKNSFCHPYNNNNNNDNNNNDNNKLSFYSVYVINCSRRFTKMY